MNQTQEEEIRLPNCQGIQIWLLSTSDTNPDDTIQPW